MNTETPLPMSPEEQKTYEAIANAVYPGIAMFARDADLPPMVAAAYKPDMIIREKGLTEASARFMGMVTTHRFVILSNHMTQPDSSLPDAGLGVFTAKRDSRFKVLGTETYRGKTGIFLLHLPDDETWKLYLKASFSIDGELYEKAVQRFRAKVEEPPVPELTTENWLVRCAFPLGLDDRGAFWPLEDKAPWETIGKGDPVSTRYYRLSSGTLLRHTAEDKYYLLSRFDGKWHENGVIKAELAWGDTPGYTEIQMEDLYETADDAVLEILIGRDRECGIRFSDKTVSRKHAVIWFNGKSWMVRDLNSTNGVLLNGERIFKAELKWNDCISVGTCEIRFLGTDLQIREKEYAEFRRLPGTAEREALFPAWKFRFAERE